MQPFKTITSLVVLLAIVLGIVLGYQQILPPAGLPAGFVEEQITLNEASAEPDLNLMLSHIRIMAREAHPVDSPALLDAQGYLKEQLTKMGYSYTEESHALSIQDILDLEQERVASGRIPFYMTEEGIREYSGIGDQPTMDLNNIWVLLDAPDTEETVLFMAHTDSVKMGPGAFDDTVSVAALLEALRQLRGVTPARDLLFLFTDGEEQGMLGAAQFVKSHPELQQRTRLVVNLEARGNQGALMLFETTENNLNLVHAYQQAVKAPVGLSIATAIYRMMKSDTDLTRFVMAGYPGINLAVIQGAEVYHTPQDNYETFDRASAAHYLDTAVGLAKHFATQPTLQLEADQNSVFFPLVRGRMVVLPESTAKLIAYAALALYLVILVTALVRKQARLGRVLLAAGLQLGLMALAFGLGILVVKAAFSLFGRDAFYDALGFTAGTPIFIILLVALSAISALIYRGVLRRQQEHQSAVLGVLLLPAVLAVVTSLLFPSASYLFSLSVLSGLVAFVLGRYCLLGLMPGIAALVTLLLFVPLVALVFIALGFTSSHLAAAVAMLPICMLLPTCLNALGVNRSV